MQNTECTRLSDRRGLGPSSQAPTRRLAAGGKTFLALQHLFFVCKPKVIAFPGWDFPP